MPQVSRRELDKNIKSRLFEIFVNSFTRLSNSSDMQKFLFDLLGPVEQIMLAKRLAIALLLVKGYQYETIKDLLKVSQETIARVNIVLNYQGEGYNLIVRKLLRDEKLEYIFEKIEDSAINLLPDSFQKTSLRKLSRSTRRKRTILG